MLNVRANYSDTPKDISSMDSNSELVPTHKSAQRAKIYIYPHEMPNGDFFMGGYIYSVIRDEQIIMERR